VGHQDNLLATLTPPPLAPRPPFDDVRVGARIVVQDRSPAMFTPHQHGVSYPCHHACPLPPPLHSSPSTLA